MKNGTQSKAEVTVMDDKHIHEKVLLSAVKTMLEAKVMKDVEKEHSTIEVTDKFVIIGIFNTASTVFIKFRIALDVFDRHKETYFKILT